MPVRGAAEHACPSPARRSAPTRSVDPPRTDRVVQGRRAGRSSAPGRRARSARRARPAAPPGRPSSHGASAQTATTPGSPAARSAARPPIECPTSATGTPGVAAGDLADRPRRVPVGVHRRRRSSRGSGSAAGRRRRRARLRAVGAPGPLQLGAERAHPPVGQPAASAAVPAVRAAAVQHEHDGAAGSGCSSPTASRRGSGVGDLGSSISADGLTRVFGSTASLRTYGATQLTARTPPTPILSRLARSDHRW